MTLPIHIALVSQSTRVAPAELAACAAAVGKQVTRDFAPIWRVPATVAAFPGPGHVPAGYWPVFILDNIREPGAAGYHTDSANRPYALVAAETGWQLTVSHETLEMLADPAGNRTVAGQSPDPHQGRVLFLVEVCDPCEAEQFSYRVDGVPVSNFLTPHYWDPIAGRAIRYDFADQLVGPRTILPGGYLSWLDPTTGHWFQQTFFGGSSPQIRDLGAMPEGGASLREWVDRQTNAASLPMVQQVTGPAPFGGLAGGTGAIDADVAATAAMERTWTSVEQHLGQPA